MDIYGYIYMENMYAYATIIYHAISAHKWMNR